MILCRQGDLFIARPSWEDRKLAQRAGFRFDDVEKVFYTPSLKVASRLKEFADRETKSYLNRFLLDDSQVPGRIRYPKNLKPLSFQIDAARFAMSRNRSYIAADPGLGKTIIAALIMNGDPNAFVIYICPPFLTLNVENEIRKWTNRRTKIHGRDVGLTLGVLLIPDSLLGRPEVEKKFKETIRLARVRKRSFLLFMDEAHRFKNLKAGRSLFLFDAYLPLVSERLVFMSGTPMPNRPLELYPVLSRCAPETIDFMNEFEFGVKYCAGRRNKFGWDFRGESNIKLLASKVIGSFMLRLRKKLLNLPPLTEEVLIIGEKLNPALIALDAKLVKEYSPEDLMKHLAPNEHVSTYRKELGKLKAKESVEYIRSLIEDTEDNLIVVTVHRDAIAILKDAFKNIKHSVIDGMVSTHKRLGVATDWQNDKTNRLMLLNNIAGGLGFNLTKATRVLFVEFDWVYETNRQVYDRAHRFGQKKSVHVEYFVYKNSIDRRVIETILRKKALGQHL